MHAIFIHAVWYSARPCGYQISGIFIRGTSHVIAQYRLCAVSYISVSVLHRMMLNEMKIHGRCNNGNVEKVEGGEIRATPRDLLFHLSSHYICSSSVSDLVRPAPRIVFSPAFSWRKKYRLYFSRQPLCYGKPIEIYDFLLFCPTHIIS